MNRKKRILCLIAALSALAALAFAIAFFSIGDSLDSQKAARRWQGKNETSFAQVTAFFPIGSEKDAETLPGFRRSFEGKFRDAGLETPENGRLWNDAWSAKCQVTLSGSRGSATASALAVGGDFFFFHPLRLRSGDYISSDDLMQDRVVLDEELAWKLFGGMDLAGLNVTIDGKPYLIAGVVAREDDGASRRAYSDGAGLFMAYETAVKDERVPGVSCYELVIANPVSHFGRNLLAEAMDGGGTNPIVENSSRFSIGAIFGVLGDLTARSMDTYGVVYPYWENAARMNESRMAICLFFFLLFALLPFVCLCVFGFKLLKKGGAALKAAAIRTKDGISDRIYYRRTEGRHKTPPPAGKKAEKEKEPAMRA